MIVLCAYYKGNIKPHNQDRFDTYLENIHMPDVAKWPKLKGLRLLKNDGKTYEDEAPQYYQSIELTFENEEDLQVSLASEQRLSTKGLSARDHESFKDLFEGDIIHTIYKATEIPIPNPGKATMIRSAYYMGDVIPERVDWMDNFSLNVHLPEVAEWPHLTRLRHLKNTGKEFFGAKPQYYHVYELSFADKLDLDRAMASEERRITRRDAAKDRDPKTGRFFGFKGEVQHTNYKIMNFI
jgi:uncharacterized protein (TIGR02118 family)